MPQPVILTHLRARQHKNPCANLSTKLMAISLWHAVDAGRGLAQCTLSKLSLN